MVQRRNGQKRSTQHNLGVIILAGGKSSRMKHNKIFLKLRGKPLIKQVVQAASEVSENIVVAIGMQDREDDYTSILPKSVSIAKDTSNEKAAILGIITGLDAISSEYAAVLAADLPFINPEVIKMLYHEVQNFDLAIPSWPNGNIEPLYAVYRVSAARRAFKGAAKDGAVRIQDAINRLKGVNYVSVEKFRSVDPSLHCFININTPEDLSAVKAILRGEDA